VHAGRRLPPVAVLQAPGSDQNGPSYTPRSLSTPGRERRGAPEDDGRRPAVAPLGLCKLPADTGTAPRGAQSAETVEGAPLAELLADVVPPPDAPLWTELAAFAS
jgi:hypothetical protein